MRRRRRESREGEAPGLETCENYLGNRWEFPTLRRTAFENTTGRDGGTGGSEEEGGVVNPNRGWRGSGLSVWLRGTIRPQPSSLPKLTSAFTCPSVFASTLL